MAFAVIIAVVGSLNAISVLLLTVIVVPDAIPGPKITSPFFNDVVSFNVNVLTPEAACVGTVLIIAP